MLRKTLLLMITIVTVSQTIAQKSNKCNYTINSYSDKFDGTDITKKGNVTVHDLASQNILNQGNKLTIQAGDVICMDASVSFGYIRFQNIVGVPGNPVIITNVGGQVEIKNTNRSVSYGWKFQNSSNFKILGNGDANHKYGFKVTTHKNSFLQFIDKTTDFEVAHVEIAGDVVAQAQEDLDAAANSRTPENLLGFAGIMAKSQPICWDEPNGGSTDKGNFEMENVFIHDNYIHDVSGEGMYLGYGRTSGVLLDTFIKVNGNKIKVKCSKKNIPHDISNLHVYNNHVENVGWDGIQVKNAHKDAFIYNNYIKNYALLANGPHDEGLFVGDGSEAEIFGNWVENGTAQSIGIKINGFGNTKIYNNVVLGAGFHGMYLNNKNYAQKSGTIEIYNNTIEGGTGNVITAYSNINNFDIKNNLGFAYGKADHLNGTTTKAIKDDGNTGVVSSNIMHKDVSLIGFNNFATGDVTLSANSIAIDTGESHSFDQYDFSGSPRIGNVDVGAFEFGSAITNPNLSIAITTPTLNSVTATPNGVRVKGTLNDPNNQVVLIKYYLRNKKFIGQDVLPRKIEHVIGYQHLKPGVNSFKMKAILANGSSFYSAPLIIIKPVTASSKSVNKLPTKVSFYYNSLNKELVVNKPVESSIKEVEIYNILGKKIQYFKNLESKNQSIKLKVNNIKSGVYIVKIKTDKNVFSKKMFL